jgi:Cu(I)/Ag(I) efflux system membrane protein CusA/SilA
VIDAVLRFCLRERLIVLLAAVGIAAYGWYAMQTVPLDAIPDVGENQVIILTEWPGRSPKDMEDQVTYPLSVAFQAVPGAKSVRGRSMFGFSFVQVTFADSVDFYWARSRVAEQLSTVSGMLPDGVVPQLAPDATALGQVLLYVLEPDGSTDLAELRSRQDFFIRYALESVEGVAEVASIGGYVREYQVDVDPDELRYHAIPLSAVISAVRESSIDVGAKTVESGGMEFIVRGRGFIGSDRTSVETRQQIEQTVIATRDGIPLRVRDVATVQEGPAFRRGALDLNGHEAVGGVVIMRYGANPRDVIQRVQEKIASLEPELDGLRIVPIYDRTGLIDETIHTLSEALAEETAITIVVVVLFLLHVQSSLVIAVTLPLAVLMAFAAMKLFGVDANIMSLAGIAIAIGTMVDMGIIVLENVYDGLAELERHPAATEGRVSSAQRLDVIRRAASEVVPAVMTAVTTTVVSFLPVFFLTGRDAKLFTPLAWTKTFALVASLIVAVTVVPALARTFLRTPSRSRLRGLLGASLVGLGGALLAGAVWGDWLTTHGWPRITVAALAGVAGSLLGWRLARERLTPMDANPASRLTRWLYAGRLRIALKHKAAMLSLPVMIFVLGLGAWIGLPTVLTPVEWLARRCGAELNDVPGYVDTKHIFTGLPSDDWIALDEGSWFYMPSLYPAASFSQAMQVLQTQDALIREIPEVANVLGKIGRIDSALDPAPAAMIETYVMLRPRDAWRPGITAADIWSEINAVATLPGVTPASPLQPIEGRVVMLQAGIKASMAVRIYGDSLDGLSEASLAVAEVLRRTPAVNAGTVNPDIVMGKPYCEFEVDREEAARYGMTTRMVNEVVAAGLGGLAATTTVEGRERYPIQVRFARDVREKIEDLPRIPVVTPAGEVVPLERLARVTTTWGPGSISSENSRLVAHVMFSPAGSGALETVAAVEKSLSAARADGSLALPEGSFELEMVGSFQNQVEANQRLMWILPSVFLINLLLHYLHFRNLPVSLVVFSGIPIACAGGMLAIAFNGIELNTAVWVGFIALAGLAADDGIVMASFIHERLRGRGVMTIAELREEVYQAGLKRIRPCVMTTITTLAALLPVLLSTGRGSDVARAMAWPVFGGMLIEPFTTFVVPTIYCGYLELRVRRGLPVGEAPQAETSLEPLASSPYLPPPGGLVEVSVS